MKYRLEEKLSSDKNWVVESPFFNIEDCRILSGAIPNLVSEGEKYFDLIYTTNEIVEIDRIKNVSRRNEKLAGKLLLKMLVLQIPELRNASYLNFNNIEVLSNNTAPKISFTTGKKIKEFTPQYYFSLSHTENVVTAACSKKQIGIDLERLKVLDKDVAESIVDNNALKVFRESLSQNKSDPQLNMDYFPIILFTQKEAVLKCAETGLTNDLADVILKTFRINGKTRMEFKEDLYLVHSSILNNYIYSVSIPTE
ncbi:MAG: 4'-phosphopantetheinyl transferase superfamily protein [Melioribacteraceae bacterium]|nr:4'-phosphopantetheinyl transferase superfamily protein [Melioribacteraceae bacterium]MCF8262881.1 4'-phosphopantetheinyl transferase superfamily protein [Melioribacteraceae bacterium]MCF8430891.1 4'-phosphopantetheinyl transferase superfamily protein [Melioribacteraceae bacterium]